MKKNIDINSPVGGFEDIKESDLKEFGDIENPDFIITPEMEVKMANLAGFRLENAEEFADRIQGGCRSDEIGLMVIGDFEQTVSKLITKITRTIKQL